MIEPQEARRLPSPLGQCRLALARRTAADDRLPQRFAGLVAAIEHEMLEDRELGKAARHLERPHQAKPRRARRSEASDVAVV